jgi:hypothetical protein
MTDKKIPPKNIVKEIIKGVVRVRLRVDSQEELARLVLKKLKKKDKHYTISPIRAKRIALEIKEMEIKAKTKKAIRLPKIESCPVCESSIKPIKIKNLLNKNVTIGYRCINCGYQSDLEAFMPMKYMFLWKGKKP